MRVLGGLRLLNLDDEVRTAPYFGGGGEDGGPGGHVFGVGDGAAFTRVGLDEHLMPGFSQSDGAAGYESYASLVIFDLFRNSNDHMSIFSALRITPRRRGESAVRGEGGSSGAWRSARRE